MDDTSKDTELDLEEIASKLKGKTLRVYWYLLKSPEEASLREIQRGAGLSSPSLASYHLDKLEGLGLVRTDQHGLYHLERNVKTGVLRFFVGSGRLLIPRFVFYAVFYTTLIPCSMVFVPLTTGPISLLLLSVLGFGAVTSWIESVRAWRMEI
ncbi:MAG: winged helix-turn-helix domain-containing protein [Candidatus Thorarchaeota archaeon]